MGKPFKSMIISLLRDIIIFIPSLIILASMNGVVGMLWAALIADVISFIIAFSILFIDNKMQHKEITVNDNKVALEVNDIPKDLVITISREYGSGGRYVGKLLAKELKIKFYDKELIKLTAEKSGLSESYIKTNEQIKNNYSIFYNNDDNIFITESEIIKKISKEPCVIIGRCADYVLENNKNVYKIYLYSDLDNKIKRCTKYYGLSKDEAIKNIKKVDKDRAKHYEYYTNRKWKDFTNYDLAINVDKLGIGGTVKAIKNVLNK